MVWSIHYFDIVQYDIKEAKDWYRQQKTGLEKEFSKEVKKAILKLKSNPLGALENDIDIILTRNKKDFKKSILPVLTAKEYLKK